MEALARRDQKRFIPAIARSRCSRPVTPAT